jgi:serine/threonine protein kinase
MPLPARTRLGPYEILALIGSGGMGEVYKARDTRLERSVALKILPAAVAIDGERKRRFEQEARAASALNHPNIMSVYDTGIEGDTLYIVTELIDGESLRALIQRGPLPIRVMLDLAVQIADGLAAAHVAGIVHRDVKPENLMITRDGRIKILDFGLAKPIPGAIGQSDTTVNVTGPGVLLGTVSYLSPEQARGLTELDGRSDQFSFGLVLYELAAGGPAFNCASAAETMAAIIREEPPPLSASVPIPFRLTIERCMAKEPKQRYDTTRDLFLELKYLKDHALELTTGPQVGAGTRHDQKIQPLTLWLWSMLIVLLVGAVIYLRSGVLRTPAPSFERLTYRRGDIRSARFSPDGQTVVFSAQWASEPITIFSARLGSRESRSLDLPPARILSISSAGELAILAGTGAAGTLARVALSGGAPREILENVNDADWSPDGKTLAISHTVRGLNRIEYPIGTVLNQSPHAPQSLRVSPKGDLLAFFEYGNEVADYAVTVLDAHGVKRVLSRGWRGVGGLAWDPEGNEIWFSGTKPGGEPALRAVNLRGQERLVIDTPAFVVPDDIARDGRVLLAVADSRVGISCLPPREKQERDLSWFDASRIYDISDDGKTILFVELSYGQARNTAIYLRKTDGSPAVRLGEGNRPKLSPDGRWVVSILSDGLQTKLNLLPTGAGEARSVPANAMHYERVEWFPDGRRLLFTGNEPNKPVRTFVQDLEGGNAMPITPDGMTAALVSPDAKYATAVVGGKLDLLPTQGGHPRPIADLDTDESVVQWSGDSRFLFLRKLENPSSMRITRLDVATSRRELWRELKTPDPVGVQIGQMVMTPDGTAYAYSFQRDIVTLYLVKGLK